LYPTELRGLIQKIFNFAGLQDSNDSIFRRILFYPLNYGGRRESAAAAGAGCRSAYFTAHPAVCQTECGKFLGPQSGPKPGRGLSNFQRQKIVHSVGSLLDYCRALY
ncbi:hypothetical protein, partial [Hominenteromicrobium sp.]